MNRHTSIAQLQSEKEFDICIIGGGATGLGIAVDAANRGYKTILLEQSDFAKGTSSRSTKLVHGGVRYLQQGNIKLVMEALKERGLLLKNAPHLVHNQQFIVPNYKWWEKPFYGIGLKIYDWMAGSLGLGPSQFLSKQEVIDKVPGLDETGLNGGILYHDGQFDDARLAIALMQTAVQKGATMLNYFSVNRLLKINQQVGGVGVKDMFTGNEYEIKSKVIINATGVFVDAIIKMDNPKHENLVSPSQGIHLVVDKDFLKTNTAIMIPKTDDGRVLFAVPWHTKVVLGTTDTPVDKIVTEPVALDTEKEFILKHIGRYLAKDPTAADVRSVFAGLRPLVKGNTKNTAALSREHFISISSTGLITITGGKWTTYRKMAADVLHIAALKNNLPPVKCSTQNLPLAGATNTIIPADISNATNEEIAAMVKIAVHEEWCQTVEDFLSRRTRQLLLDVAVAKTKAPLVAKLLAIELNKDVHWVNDQIIIFNQIADGYTMKG
jgi:glycerol-3-phosphate dehydrogenase